jgi:RsiW-degrading membrane proteinase PrsW (M82 family)
MGAAAAQALSIAVAILPVLALLALLKFLDSFKLVRFPVILRMIAAGGCAGLIAYLINGYLLSATAMELHSYSRYVAPVIEELLKASVLVYLFGRHRVGFLVDAAILGFAVGAGFAVIENSYLLFNAQMQLGVWIVRGFGTAVMHGGVTAIFAILTMAAIERREALTPVTCLPGIAAATLIHSAYNHVFFSPVLSALGIFVFMPPFMIWVFSRSNETLTGWMELDFDADVDLLQQLNSHEFRATHVGQYLRALGERFDGMTLADMLCYLRIYTELSLRAKGAMMMRELDVVAPPDPALAGMFAEMRALEKSVGKTALLALAPLVNTNRRDRWHLGQLEAELGGT